MPARFFLLPLLLAAQPFWNERAATEWSDAELKSMLTESPWVQGVSPAPVVQAVLVTARPVQEAEAELARRHLKNPLTGSGPQAPDLDYLDYVKAHRDEHFVLAIPYTDLSRLGHADEQKRMEEETVLRIGKRRVRMLGHFPPTPSDPVLRLIFPRAATTSDKTLVFDLYLPGVPQPSRMVEFKVRDLVYHGKLEM